MTDEPLLRVTRISELAEIDALMKASTRDLFPNFYDANQTEASIEHVASVDMMVVEDGTYFVLELDGELVAGGGWSRRDKLYTGSGDAADTLRCSIRRLSQRVSAQCSCDRIGPGAGSGRAS